MHELSFLSPVTTIEQLPLSKGILATIYQEEICCEYDEQRKCEKCAIL